MKHSSNTPDLVSRIMPGSILSIIVVLFSVCAMAQSSKPVAKSTAQPAKAMPLSTTPPPPTTPAKPVVTTGLIADGAVHFSTTKLVAINDPDYKKTTKYANRQKKYSKAMDDTARKTITLSDGSHINLKFVKDPSFSGQATSYKSTTAKGSEKKDTKKTDSIQWDCASSSIALTASSTSFLNADYQAQAGYIYPGAIYAFDNFFGGSYNEQTGVRYPITLINESPNASGSGYIVINSPNQATALAGTKKLRDALKGPAGTEAFTYQIYETGNSASQSLQVTGGGSYDGFSASNNYSTSGSSNSVNLTIDATKFLYTIDLQDQDSGFFADSKIESIKNLIVVSQVTYGIRALANLTYTFATSQEADQFKAAYSGFGAKVNFSLSQMSQSSSTSSTINCYTVGGSSQSAVPSFNKAQLEKQLDAIFASATYQNAQPIAYTLKDMAGDEIGSYSATDNFTIRNCVPNTNGARLKSVWANISTGSSGKKGDTHYWVSLYGGNAGTTNGYNGYDNNPPQTVDNHEPFISMYKTGPLNVVFNNGDNTTIPLTTNSFIRDFTTSSGVYSDLNMGYFVKNGGIVHLHIWPNGSDTWNIQGLVLTLNFDGAPSQNISFSKFTLSQNSTEMTLYFDGTFKQK